MPERRHCSVGPLCNACVRPSWLTGRRDQRPPRGGLIAGLVVGGAAFLLCGLAREDGVSVYGDVGCAGLIASKLAPTVFCVVFRCCEHPRSHMVFCVVSRCCEHLRSPVGASLLAIAVYQFAVVLNVPTPSRAGSLPQEKRGPTKNQVGYQAASWWTLIWGTPSLGEVPSGGAKRFWLLLAGPAPGSSKSDPL